MDYGDIGNQPYRDIVKFRWCMEVDAEKQANDSKGGEGPTLYSKETLLAGG